MHCRSRRVAGGCQAQATNQRGLVLVMQLLHALHHSAPHFVYDGLLYGLCACNDFMHATTHGLDFSMCADYLHVCMFAWA